VQNPPRRKLPRELFGSKLADEVLDALRDRMPSTVT
jgi:hypothetical protein